MLKILLKKQLAGLMAGIVTNRRTGKRRSKGALIGYLVLLLFCGLMTMVSIAAMLYLFAQMLLQGDPQILTGSGQSGEEGAILTFSQILKNAESYSVFTGNIGKYPLIDWAGGIYFIIVGVFTAAIGLIGGMFSTYSILYCAKDNETLLAMPFKPSDILLSRMLSVYLLLLMYTLIVFIPGIVIFFIFVGFSILVLLKALAMYLMFTLLMLAISCLLGWLLEIVAAKLGGKKAVTVISIIVAMGVYLLFNLGRMKLMEALTGDLFGFDEKVKTFGYPLYAYAHGSVNDTVSFLLFCVIALACAALTCFLLSRSFISLITSKKSFKKKVYVEKAARTRSVFTALFRRDLRLYLTNPMYLMNTALLSLLLAVAAVVLLFNYNQLHYFNAWASESSGEYLFPLLALPLVGLSASMITISSASISIEGKTLWLLQSFPVAGNQVLGSKMLLHMLFAGIPSLMMAVCMSIAFGFPVAAGIVISVSSVLFNLFVCGVGLTLEARNPKLDWVDESMAVKQNMNTLFSFLAGGGLALAMGGISMVLYLKFHVPGPALLAFQAVVTAGLAFWFTRVALRQWPRLTEIK